MRIAEGSMVFLAEGKEGIGAVREVAGDALIVYVENAGDFPVPLSAVKAIHDQKVILDASRLDPKLLAAVRHAHDSEDPKLVG